MGTLRTLARIASSVALWALMIVGAGSLAVWGLNAAGLVQPLIVVSGSMSPAIETGDLLFATATDARELSVGDIATVRSAVTGDLVTHRVVGIGDSDGMIAIRMQGDANAIPDVEEYLLAPGERVWEPRLTVAGGGFVVHALMRPAVAIPLVLGILALCSLSLFPSRRDADAVDDATAPVRTRSAAPRYRRRQQAAT